MSPAERHALKVLEVKRDLERVAMKFYGGRYRPGTAPPRRYYQRHGRYKVNRICKLTGEERWALAVQCWGLKSLCAAGAEALPPVARRRIIAALHEVARQVGEPDLMPTIEQFVTLNTDGYIEGDVLQLAADGETSRGRIYHTVSWADAAREAGLKPRWALRTNNSRERIISQYRDLAYKVEKTKAGDFGPTQREFWATVNYGNRELRKYFHGGFNELVEAAGFKARAARGGRKFSLSRQAA
jgi:hypothetical protein